MFKILRKTAQPLFVIFLGLLFLFLLLEAGLYCFGKAVNFGSNLSNRRPVSARHTIACFGESVTFTGYPAALEKMLHEKYPGSGVCVINNAVSGTASGYICEIFPRKLQETRPDIALIMTGINDDTDPRLFDGFALGADIPWFYRLRTVRLFLFLKPIVKALFVSRAGSEQEKDRCRQQLDTSLEKMHSFINLRQQWQELQERNRNVVAYSDEFFRLIDYQAMFNNYLSLGLFDESLALVNQVLSMFDPQQHSASIFFIMQYYMEIIFIHQSSMEEVNLVIDECKKRMPGFDDEWENFRAYILLQMGKKDVLNNLGQKYASEVLFFMCAQDRAAALREKLLRELAVLEQSADSSFSAQTMKADLLSAVGMSWLHDKNPGRAAPYFDEADKIRALHINNKTVKNIRYLAEEALSQGVLPVFVQYPCRSVEPLEQILAPYAGRVVIVDNEKLFKDAVLKKGYPYYFFDSFASDFGHLSRDGEKLIAQNIMSALEKRLELKK